MSFAILEIMTSAVFSNSKLVTAMLVRAVPYLAIRCGTILPHIYNSVTKTCTGTAKIEQNLVKT